MKTLTIVNMPHDAKMSMGYNGTVDIVIMPKGYYVTTRYNGMIHSHEYFKTKTAMSARVKELKREGYTETR